MSQLVAYYDEKPVELKGKVDILQSPLPVNAGLRSPEGVLRTSVVYVPAPSDPGLLIPFGRYDEWTLRDRYNEAIRIMNMLGAATVTCEAFGNAAVRRGLRAKVRANGTEPGGEIAQRRIENSGFDYRHEGSGSPPRDPRPLRWPDEPGFAAAVSGVLDNGVTEVELSIRSNRTFAIEGSLGVQLVDLGFDLGGGSERSDATSLHIRATFPQARRGWR